jgi:isoquinoline 1-oxidoreductase beta subunit
VSDTTPITVDPAGHPRWRPTRRGFLIGAGLAGAGVALGWVVGLPRLRLRMAEEFESGSQPSSTSSEPSAWFEIAPDGQVTMAMTKVEMGQGVHTALAQIAVEELAVAWSSLSVVQASTRQRSDDTSATSGSNSVSSQYPIIREAAATLREMLRHQASARLGVPVAELVARDGEVVKVDDPTVRISYGALADGADIATWEVPEEVPLSDPADFKVIGQSLPRVDLPAKLRGEALYGYDARLAGFCFGAVARPPQLGARLAAAEAGPAADMPGVVHVLIEDGFAGVVATSRAEAAAARDALVLRWEGGRDWQQSDIDARMVVGGPGGVVIQDEGDAARALTEGGDGARQLVEAEYVTPLAAHVTMEPQATLADARGKFSAGDDEGNPIAGIWCSTQMASLVRDKVAEALDLPAERVDVVPTYLGGGLGRKAGYEVAVEAARLSWAAAVPVHVGWTREEDMRHGYFRPPTRHLLRGRLGDDGRLEAIEHQIASGDVARPFMPAAFSAVVGADFGAWRGGRLFYAIPSRRAIIWRRELPVPTSWWRGLGLLPNVFAIESFIDEAALAVGADPLAFRLQHAPPGEIGRRLRAVLEAAAERAGWGSPPPGRGLGIACCIDVDTVVAQVAEVSVADDGQVRVHRVTCALDAGLVVNPDGIIAQVQGAIVMGLSSALLEEITVADGQIVQTNFNSYPILTLRETPEIDVVLLDAGDGVPRGVGEPPIGPVAAAVANAIAALGGPRLRVLPLTAERVRAARVGA